MGYIYLVILILLTFPCFQAPPVPINFRCRDDSNSRHPFCPKMDMFSFLMAQQQIKTTKHLVKNENLITTTSSTKTEDQNKYVREPISINTIPTIPEDQNTYLRGSKPINTTPKTPEDQNTYLREPISINTIPTIPEDLKTYLIGAKPINTPQTTPEDLKTNFRGSKPINTTPTIPEDLKTNLRGSKLINTQPPTPKDQNTYLIEPISINTIPTIPEDQNTYLSEPISINTTPTTSEDLRTYLGGLKPINTPPTTPGNQKVYRWDPIRMVEDTTKKQTTNLIDPNGVEKPSTTNLTEKQTSRVRKWVCRPGRTCKFSNDEGYAQWGGQPPTTTTTTTTKRPVVAEVYYDGDGDGCAERTGCGAMRKCFQKIFQNVNGISILKHGFTWPNITYNIPAPDAA